MTPEQAQELLDYHDKMHGFDITINEIENLLKQVASLRYEYAVEIKHGDGWITSRHHTPTIETAKEIAARYKRTDTRIVRRLATQPEVVE